MVDFWLTIGTLIAEPALVGVIRAAGPTFHQIGLRVRWNDHTKDIPMASAGEYLEGPTNAVRNALNGYFASVHPGYGIPISLSTAAKLCQLIAVGTGGGTPFFTTIDGFAQQYLNLAHKHQPEISREFLSLLGLSMIDVEVRRQLQADLSPELKAALYIDPSPQQRSVLQALTAPLADPNLEPGIDLLSGPTWDHGCFQVFYFYDQFKRAVY